MAAKRTALPKFLSLTHLAKWLRSSADGQRLLRELQPETQPPSRVPVLVVLHWDGKVEVYGPHADLRVFMVVQPIAVTGEEQTEVEIWMEDHVLPPSFRGLWWPTAVSGVTRGGLLSRGYCRRQTFDGMLQAKLESDLLREMESWTK